MKINSNHGAESMQSGSRAGRAVEGCSDKLNSKNLSLYLTKHCSENVKESKHCLQNPFYGHFTNGQIHTESSISFIDFTVKPGFKREAPLQWQHVFFLLHAWICLQKLIQFYGTKSFGIWWIWLVLHRLERSVNVDSKSCRINMVKFKEMLINTKSLVGVIIFISSVMFYVSLIQILQPRKSQINTGI